MLFIVGAWDFVRGVTKDYITKLVGLLPPSGLIVYYIRMQRTPNICILETHFNPLKRYRKIHICRDIILRSCKMLVRVRKVLKYYIFCINKKNNMNTSDTVVAWK